MAKDDIFELIRFNSRGQLAAKHWLLAALHIWKTFTWNEHHLRP